VWSGSTAIFSVPLHGCTLGAANRIRVTNTGPGRERHSSLTQDFLSEMLGVRRTTLTVVAGALQEGGLIRYSRGRVQIVDGSGIEKRACECYAAIRQRTEEGLPQSGECTSEGGGEWRKPARTADNHARPRPLSPTCKKLTSNAFI
jgi:hypothetical protein